MTRVGIMWAKLAALAAVVAVLLSVLLAPAMTVKVSIDLPPGMPPPTSAQMDRGFSILNLVATLLTLTVVIGPAGYLAWRVVRAHRRPPHTPTET